FLERDNNMNFQGLAFKPDYVVGCTEYEGEWDETEKIMRVQMLLKYTGYPCASYENYDTESGMETWMGMKAIQEWRWRESMLSKVRQQMRADCEAAGQNFDAIYPEVSGPENAYYRHYISFQRLKRRTLLRAREQMINEILRRGSCAPLFVEDWTGNPSDDGNLLNFI
ncbi:hypothetical protein PENTCL1PPCAC_19672, partial [Pristionchus entomophagus]